jgi:hypothetical protein
MKALKAQINRAIAGAATLTGKRFGLLVASSLVATSVIVAAAMTTPGDNGALATLLGRSLASEEVPVTSPPVTPEPVSEGGGGGSTSSGPSPAPSGPVESSAPSEPVEEAPPQDEPEEATPTTPPPATPEAGRIKHVFLVSVTSPGYEAAFGATPQMPYLAGTLRPKGQLLSGYKLLGNAGLPNRIAAVSGQPPNAATQAECTTYAEFPAGAKLNAQGIASGAGCVYPVETLTIADQLAGGRFSWRGYFDGMVDETGKPDNCVRPEAEGADQAVPGGYGASRNPFVYFHSLLDLGDCSTNDLPLTQLPTDLRKIDSTPNFSYISPTPCTAGTAGQCLPEAVEGPAAADAFLAEWVPKVLASPAYKKDGLLIVAFDQAGGEAKATDAVGALLLSRFAAAGSVDDNEYTPYSLLKSTEELFGLSYLAKAKAVKVRSFAPALLGTNGGD